MKNIWEILVTIFSVLFGLIIIVLISLSDLRDMSCQSINIKASREEYVRNKSKELIDMRYDYEQAKRDGNWDEALRLSGLIQKTQNEINEARQDTYTEKQKGEYNPLRDYINSHQ